MYSKILISKRKTPKILLGKLAILQREALVTSFAKGGLPLQNLLLPFASLVRRENKFRVIFLFLMFEILEHLL